MKQTKMLQTAFNLQSSGIEGLKILSELPAGENNFSYLCRDDSGAQYVLRKKKPGSATPSLKTESDTLRFLEYAGIAFAPRSIHYDPVQNIHIISYVDGVDIQPHNLDKDAATTLAQHLAELHSIPFSLYADWCEKNDVPIRIPETREKTMATYFTGPAAFIEKECPDRALAGWIKQQFTQNDFITSASQENMFETGLPASRFVHGDLGGNMKQDDGDLFFIDWECARFLEFNELAYIFVHGSCSDSVQRHVLDVYADCFGMNKHQQKALAEQTTFEMALLRVDKVLWRTNKYTELAAAGAPEAEKYRKQAYNTLKEQGITLSAKTGKATVPRRAL